MKKLYKKNKNINMKINQKERKQLKIDKDIYINFNKNNWKLYLSPNKLNNDEFISYHRTLGMTKTIGSFYIPVVLFDLVDYTQYIYYEYTPVKYNDTLLFRVDFII